MKVKMQIRPNVLEEINVLGFLEQELAKEGWETFGLVDDGGKVRAVLYDGMTLGDFLVVEREGEGNTQGRPYLVSAVNREQKGDQIGIYQVVRLKKGQSVFQVIEHMGCANGIMHLRVPEERRVSEMEFRTWYNPKKDTTAKAQLRMKGHPYGLVGSLCEHVQKYLV